MAEKFYAKSPGNEGYIKNMEVLSYHDLDNNYAFQSALYKTDAGKYYLYFGLYKGTGVMILDVTDPVKPQKVKYMDIVDPKEYPYMATPKIQICDDLMIVAMSNCIPHVHGAPPVENPPLVPGGMKIFSLKEDPENPKYLSTWLTGVEGFDLGVHRFTYNGGRYVHVTAGAPGFYMTIYRIIDIIDPCNPVEVGRWWLPGQFFGNQTDETIAREHHGWFQAENYPGFIHYVYADTDKNLAYLSCVGQGFKILDISNVQVPKLIGEIAMNPPFGNSSAICHTFMPIHGTNFAIGTQEGDRYWNYTKELLDSPYFNTYSFNGIEMFDVSDPKKPTMVAVFPYPEVPADFPYENFNFCGLPKSGPFGPHNMHEPMTNKPWIENRKDRAYNAYFHAGLRVYDTSDPYRPKEIAYFIPPNPEKLCWELHVANPPLGTTEDLVVDDRGYIYCNAMHDGVYILKCLV